MGIACALVAAACGSGIGGEGGQLPPAVGEQPDESEIGEAIPLPKPTGPMLEPVPGHPTGFVPPTDSEPARPVTDAKADKNLRDDRARFGLPVDQKTFERAIEDTYAREVAGALENPLAIPLTDEELASALAYTDSTEARHRFADFLDEHSDTAASYVFNDDIDDPHFTIQVTDRFPEQARGRAVGLLPPGTSHDIARVEFSADEVEEYALEIEGTLGEGKPDTTGVARALERVGLRPISVEFVPSSQSVTLVVDDAGESRAEQVLTSLLAGELPPQAKAHGRRDVPIDVVKGRPDEDGRGRRDSPGQARAGLFLTIGCTTTASVALGDRRFIMTAGHCSNGTHRHNKTTYSTSSPYRQRDVDGNNSTWAYDYQVVEYPIDKRGLGGPYVMSVSSVSGNAYTATLTSENTALERVNDVVCYEGSAGNRTTYAGPLSFVDNNGNPFAPDRTLCGFIKDDHTGEGFVQLEAVMCKGDSGGVVRYGGRVYGLAANLEGTRMVPFTNDKCSSRLNYARIGPQLDHVSSSAKLVTTGLSRRTAQLVGNNAGKCMSAADSGLTNWTDYLQWDCLYNPPWSQTPHEAQSFYFEPVADNYGNTDRYRLVRYRGSTKTCASIDTTTGGGGYGNWAEVHLWDCIGASHPLQVWQLVHHDLGNNGWLHVRSEGSNRCLSVPYSSMANGEQLHLWGCMYWHSAQQWRIR